MTYATAESRDIAAPAQKVWELVSDLPRMGEFSPENEGGKWARGATGPVVGATFSGRNKNGFRRWSTTATVVKCDPGKLFEIAITSGPVAIANWRYEFEETAEGCRVTESWDDHRQLWMRIMGRPLGVHDAAHARLEMVATLGNLAQALEVSAGGS
jgi:polyketide cyclase/dehydrase/lipid transport protein